VKPPFDEIASLDRLVHEPARMAILTVLAACDKADFVFLVNVTGLTKGNLSSHLTKLQQGGLVEAEKQLEGGYPVTYLKLTPEGRDRFEEHWRRLAHIRESARAWKPLPTT
jgi:DNA-binding transcriptional ArsR family regulator